MGHIVAAMLLANLSFIPSSKGQAWHVVGFHFCTRALLPRASGLRSTYLKWCAQQDVTDGCKVAAEKTALPLRSQTSLAPPPSPSALLCHPAGKWCGQPIHAPTFLTSGTDVGPLGNPCLVSSCTEIHGLLHPAPSLRAPHGAVLPVPLLSCRGLGPPSCG